ncbi:TPA: hypothetical protein MHS45_15850 [Klebsiella pneumoniae]|nr:hypothetical protein D4N21_29985 [Klebsiella variicola]HBX2374609.1 hypothetical protein [Klebsiella pneumoniae]HBX2452341.1 hypothetical protein [Klebsiella pneumoniae]
MFFSYFSNTRELNTVAAKPYPLKTPQTPLCAVGLVPISYHQKLVSGPFPHTIKYPHRARVVSAVPGCLAVPPVPGYG